MVRPVNFSIAFIFYAFSFLFQANSNANERLIQKKIPIITIQSENLSPEQIGLEIGVQSKRLFPNIEQLYDRHLSVVVNQTQFKNILKNKLPYLLSQIDKKYLDEMNGVAASWTIVQANILGDGFLSMDEYFLLNVLSDIGYAPNGAGFGAFAKAAKGGYPIVGRNLDWKSSPELRYLQAITVYKYSEDTAIVNIGFAGIVSFLTGFNQQGLFLSLSNAEPYTPYIQHNTSRSSENKSSSNIFLLREALEKAKTIQQTSKYLSKAAFETGKNILAADKTQIRIFEFQAKKSFKNRSWKSQTHINKPWGRKQQIASIDCHVLASLPDNCTESQDNYRWFRFHKLAQFNVDNPATVRDISSIVLDTYNDKAEIFNASTLNSLVFKPESNGLYLYSASESTREGLQVVHIPYLNLLSSKEVTLNNKKTNSINTLNIIWMFLLLMFVFIAWSLKLPYKALKKCKEMLN